MFITRKLFNIPYIQYSQLQIKLRKNRKEGILFLEHEPTITAGKNTNLKNLLVSTDFLSEKKITFLNVERGGDLTAHEKGQLVIYLHIDLLNRKLNIQNYLDILSQTLIESIARIWSLPLIQKKEAPGLYLEKDPQKKILSQGIFFKSFFTSYGVALNLKNNLEVFQMIHPCGGDSKNIVSIQSLGLDTHLENEFIEYFTKKFLEKMESINKIINHTA
jgi:lipoyl(octanoyl) transferase